jgi:hypothetical protein
MQYTIHHPFGGVLNTECVRGQHEYQEVAFVHANSLSEAYFKSQNDFNVQYAVLNIRSTSVGDIITDPSGKHHMVKPSGYVEVPGSLLNHVNFSNHKNRVASF